MNHADLRRIAQPASLGLQVAELRKERGWQQDELAERTNVSRMTISRLENGENVGIETVLRALSELGQMVLLAPKNARVQVVADAS